MAVINLDYKFQHAKFKLNGAHYSNENLLEQARNFINEGLPYQQTIGNFLLDWFNEDPSITLKTSGSTGKPKRIKMSKQAMVNSALATGEIFNLKPGNAALHCLPTQYIAGKMMLVRALVLGLEIDLVEPTSKLIFNKTKPYHFCAMVPLQLEKNAQKINAIKIIIVGGTAVSNALINKIKNIKPVIYETYGMTETVSHIAIKKLNNFEFLSKNNHINTAKTYFKTLPNISISIDERNCLVIEAPKLSDKKIITNDLVKIHHKNSFEWLGRFDNVINSGGVKLFPELIEAKLKNKIHKRFFIASKPDAILGEQLILVVEDITNNMEDAVFSDLNTFEKPKNIYAINNFMETTSGKIKRKETLNLILF